MKERTTTEELFTRLDLEKKTGELLPLDIEIYKKTLSFSDSKESENKETQEKNRGKILTALKSKRTQKILTYVAYARQLPKPIPEEEERLYIHIKKIIDEENGAPKTTKIKIIADTPEIRTPEGRKLGPFGKNTIVEIESQQELEFLIKNRIGETTN